MEQRLISADSHVKIAHDQVKNHLAPRLHENYDKAAASYEARMSRGTGAANRAGATGDTSTTKKSDPTAAANSVFGRAGYWDSTERLKDMDLDGVDVEVLYSEVSAFRYLSSVTEGVAETIRAFNDTLHEFASADPRRLVVSYQIPIHNVDIAVAEVERVVSLGGKSLQLPVFPSELGLPDYYHDRYTPLLSAIEASGLPICCHIGLKTTLEELGERDPTPNKGVMVPVTPLLTAEALGMWIMGGVLERYPDLKVVFVEPGLGWVPWWLETVDDMATRQGYKFPDIRMLPSQYFHRNIFVTFVDEHYGLERARDLLGAHNIMWSTDFPHPVTCWPNSVRTVEDLFGELPADERELIVSGNASRVWGV